MPRRVSFRARLRRWHQGEVPAQQGQVAPDLETAGHVPLPKGTAPDQRRCPISECRSYPEARRAAPRQRRSAPPTARAASTGCAALTAFWASHRWTAASIACIRCQKPTLRSADHVHTRSPGSAARNSSRNSAAPAWNQSSKPAGTGDCRGAARREPVPPWARQPEPRPVTFTGRPGGLESSDLLAELPDIVHRDPFSA